MREERKRRGELAEGIRIGTELKSLIRSNFGCSIAIQPSVTVISKALPTEREHGTAQWNRWMGPTQDLKVQLWI